jgi:hypothetical protein
MRTPDVAVILNQFDQQSNAVGEDGYVRIFERTTRRTTLATTSVFQGLGAKSASGKTCNPLPKCAAANDIGFASPRTPCLLFL